MSVAWALNSISAEQAVPLTPLEAASGLFGSVSLTLWIFLLFPQLIENYRNGSADAVSLLFLFVWFVGDIANLAGAIWAGLVPVTIAIAVYFCLAEGVLISQCLYYKMRNARSDVRHRRRSSADSPEPTTPLLGRQPGDIMPESYESVNGRRRNSRAEDAVTKIPEEGYGRSAWFKNTISLLAICVVAVVGWAIAWKTGVWKPTSQEHNGGVDMAMGAQVLGYISAIAYLGARLPQIYKNYCDKSCEGLSLLFFILSLMGNLTYGAAIICHSTDKKYIVTNLSWLIGSLGTMAEDVVIFAQFRMYAVSPTEEAGP